jgi:uncharacterized membrane protein YeaQ/YmgE (transglycosylase-associated protein family)
MRILSWILFGLVVGIVAKFLMPGRDPGGVIITVLIGVAGSLIGGFLGQLLGIYQAGEAAGFLMSIVGAILLLFVWRKLSPARLAG